MAMPLEQYQRVIAAQLRASPAKSAVLFIGMGVLVFLVIRQVTGGAGQADAESVQDWAIDPAETTAPPIAGPVTRDRKPVPDIPDTIHRDPFGLEWIAGAGQLDLGSDAGVEHTDKITLELQSTITAEGIAPSAVINGVIVREGAYVEGFVVESIGDRIVVLRRGGHRRALTMP